MNVKAQALLNVTLHGMSSFLPQPHWPQRKTPSIHWMESPMNPRTGLTVYKKTKFSFSCQDSNHHSIVQPTALFTVPTGIRRKENNHWSLRPLDCQNLLVRRKFDWDDWTLVFHAKACCHLVCRALDNHSSNTTWTDCKYLNKSSKNFLQDAYTSSNTELLIVTLHSVRH